MTLAQFVRRDLWRNPRRTLASLVGVIVGVGLFSAVLFFVDGSGAAMTRRAVAPLSLDMQRVLTAPLGGGVRYERKLTDDQLETGESTRVTLTVANDGVAPAHEVVVRDRLREPLTYVPGSTLLDGALVPDVDGRIPLAQGEAGTGLNIGTVEPGTTRQIVYRVTADSEVTATLPADATISTREAPSPARANAPRPVPLPALAEQIRELVGVAAADTLAFVDLPGRISANGAELGGPVKLFAFDAGYPARYQSIKMRSGSLRPGSMVISAETARDLGIGEGATVTLELPGGVAPLALPISGVTDLSGAKPLFESREWRRFEKFVYAPHAVVVDPEIYAERIVPAFTAAAAQLDSGITSFPFEELDISVDRAVLNADPGSALAQTLQIADAVKAVAPGQDYLLDNISNTLAVAEGDAVVAKRMFAFLGLPGAILAAILTAYAGALLAGAQRREGALLRVRGASRRHLMYMLSLRTVALAGVGSILGTVLGFGTVLVLLGHPILFEASTGALLQSALVGVGGGMAVTALALYVPGRRLVTREIKQELGSGQGQVRPAWRRLGFEFAALVGAVAAQVAALRNGALDGPSGSVYSGRSVSLPLHLLIAPLVAWLAGTMLIAHLLQAVTAHSARTRKAPDFRRLLAGILWRSITRRLGALVGGVVTVALVVGLGTMLACFATVYDKAKVSDARFLVGSDIRLTPNPTSGFPSGAELASQLVVDGIGGATAVVFSPENSVLTSRVHEEVTALAAIDPLSYPKVAALEDSSFVGTTAAAAMSALAAQPDGVLVNAGLATGLKLAVGDQAHVLFGRGNDEQVRKPVEVVGLFTRFPGAPRGTDLVANLGHYQRETGLDVADYYLVSTAEPGPPGLERALRALTSSPDFERRFEVSTSALTLDKDKSSLTALNVRGLLHLDSFFTFLMAATATAMFVFGLLMQRRREYVTMRAQGLHRREVRRLVLAESGISAILGALIGLGVGIAVASEFVRVLRPIFTLPPPLAVPAAELAILAALVLGATALSAAAAALLINRLEPTELLREE